MVFLLIRSFHSYSRSRLRREWNIPDDIPLIGMVARFNPDKDYPNLLKSLSFLRSSGKSFKVVLVGTGVDAPIPIYILNYFLPTYKYCSTPCPRDDIPSVMTALDLFVLPPVLRLSLTYLLNLCCVRLHVLVLTLVTHL